MVVGRNSNFDEDDSSSSSSSMSSTDGSAESDSSRTTIASSDDATTTTSTGDDSNGIDESSVEEPLFSLDDDEWFEPEPVIDVYASSVRDWTEKVPIGMKLCPWARLSQKEGRIRYVTCPERVRTQRQASEVVWEEIDKLRGNNRSLPPWSTALVICPHVEAWKTDFEAFEAFVTGFGTTKHHGQSAAAAAATPPLPDGEEPLPSTTASGRSLRAITLVPFHPRFVRWWGLPETITAGSFVFCHRGLVGFSKSPEAHPATVVDPQPPGFGKRRIRVRFRDEMLPPSSSSNTTTTTPNRKGTTEQCVPVDWVVLDGEADGLETTGDSSSSSSNNTTTKKNHHHHRSPLPDNNMHRSPYPVIHILRNEDLAAPTIHEISRLKRRNAKRMASETLS